MAPQEGSAASPVCRIPSSTRPGRLSFLGMERYETRKQERWRHPVAGYSLSYQRAMELEARLLEKEWSGAPGLFARMRLRG